MTCPWSWFWAIQLLYCIISKTPRNFISNLMIKPLIFCHWPLVDSGNRGGQIILPVVGYHSNFVNPFFFCTDFSWLLSHLFMEELKKNFSELKNLRLLLAPFENVIIANFLFFFPSIVPLLKESIGILMQRTPPSLENALPQCYQRVSSSAVFALIDQAADWLSLSCVYEDILWFSSNASQRYFRILKWRYQFI